MGIGVAVWGEREERAGGCEAGVVIIGDVIVIGRGDGDG